MRRARQAPDIASDRGAATIEFAVTAVVLFILIFGVVEGGLFFRSHLALSNSTDEAARRAAIVMDDDDADWQVLRQVLEHSVDRGGSISQVVVFRGDSAGSEPPASCLLGIDTPGECNVYEADDLARPATDFGSCGALDGSWCPVNRGQVEGEHIGVRISGAFDSVTGTLPSIDLVQQTVVSYEPRSQ